METKNCFHYFCNVIVVQILVNRLTSHNKKSAECKINYICSKTIFFKKIFYIYPIKQLSSLNITHDKQIQKKKKFYIFIYSPEAKKNLKHFYILNQKKKSCIDLKLQNLKKLPYLLKIKNHFLFFLYSSRQKVIFTAPS